MIEDTPWQIAIGKLKKTQIGFTLAATNRQFKWGDEDCALFLANWWRHIHGTDPAAWLRGTYSTAEGADAVVRANRGLQRLVTRIASEVGASRTTTPKLGDFGLIAHNGKPYGAICIGTAGKASFWAVRAAESVAFLTNPRILRAWSLFNPVEQEN